MKVKELISCLEAIPNENADIYVLDGKADDIREILCVRYISNLHEKDKDDSQWVEIWFQG